MEKLNEDRLRKIASLFEHPRPGSKIAAAKEFGIDLTLTFQQLKKTPQQRVDDMQSAMRSLESFSQQARESRTKNND